MGSAISYFFSQMGRKQPNSKVPAQTNSLERCSRLDNQMREGVERKSGKGAKSHARMVPTWSLHFIELPIITPFSAWPSPLFPFATWIMFILSAALLTQCLKGHTKWICRCHLLARLNRQIINKCLRSRCNTKDSLTVFMESKRSVHSNHFISNPIKISKLTQANVIHKNISNTKNPTTKSTKKAYIQRT